MGVTLKDLQKTFEMWSEIKWNILVFEHQQLNECYLSNRKFYICIDNVFSEAVALKYGLPHGSILGSILFLLNVNDLPQSLSEAHSYLYGDGTFIFYKHEEDVKKIEIVLNKKFS